MSKEENRDGDREEKAAGSSRLGKEAKIGVTVIAVLLLVLGVVATVRLTRSSSDDKLASATDRESGRERVGGEGKTGTMLKDTRSKLFGKGAGNSPTVVSAGPPKTTAGDSDPWKLVADRGESKRAGSGGPSLSTPPSLMPDPPKPSDANRHERYALDPPAGRDVDNASVDAAPALPPYRENSRLEHPTPQPPTSSHADPSYLGSKERSAPTMPVAPYGTNEYRRESVGARYNDSAPRRSAAASLYSNPPPRRDDGKYEVQPNDSYWTISERLYGTGAYFKALAQQNRGKGAGEDRLQPGELILAPEVAQLEKSYPDLCPKPSRREALQSQSQSRASTVSSHNSYRGGRTYTVVEGDTLFNIARYELGKASRWAEIYDLNRDVLGKDFNYLTPGTPLALPEGDKSDVIAQPPGNVYRR